MSVFKKSPDEPIATSKEDRFGRENFANAVAEALVTVPNHKSITVGLYGTWGSGKTSIINLATGHLAQKHGENVVVIKFNPWIFSSTESLHMAFFGVLASQLRNKLQKGERNIATALQKYGELTGSVGNVAGLFFPPAGIIAKALPFFAKAISAKEVDIEATRKQVDKLLVDSGKRVIVIIDDIDRLDSDEIHQIFKLVKNIAHFSNVSYLLSFDQVVVAEALAQRYPANPAVGGNFIDKIVQLPLYVPSVDQSLLNKYLTEELDKIILQSKLDITEDDMSRFQIAYFNRGAEDLFDTPRKVVRYLNTIDFSIERLGNETSFTDIALIDLLRNFYPELYKRLADNRDLILGQGVHGERDGQQQAITKKVLFGSSNPDSMEVVLTRELFPTLDWVFGGSGWGGDFTKSWEEEKRICSDKYFNRYFSYDIPIGDVADAKIDSLLLALDPSSITPAKAIKLFENMSKKSDLTLLISKLRHREEDLNPTVSENLAKVLVATGSSFPRPKQALAGDRLSAYVQSAVLAVRLTRNTGKPYDLLTAFLKEVSLDYAIQLFNWVRVNTEKEKGDGEDFKPLISADELETLGKSLAQRIKAYGRNHNLQAEFPHDVAYIMWIWEKWGEKADIKRYLERSFNNSPSHAIEFLMAYVGDAWEMGTGKKTRTEFRREAYDSIAAVVEPDIFVEPLIKLYGEQVNKGEYSEARFDKSKSYEFQVAQQFLFIHRKVKDESKSPERQDILEGEVVSSGND